MRRTLDLDEDLVWYEEYIVILIRTRRDSYLCENLAIVLCTWWRVLGDYETVRKTSVVCTLHEIEDCTEQWGIEVTSGLKSITRRSGGNQANEDLLRQDLTVLWRSFVRKKSGAKRGVAAGGARELVAQRDAKLLSIVATNLFRGAWDSDEESYVSVTPRLKHVNSDLTVRCVTKTIEWFGHAAENWVLSCAEKVTSRVQKLFVKNRKARSHTKGQQRC